MYRFFHINKRILKCLIMVAMVIITLRVINVDAGYSGIYSDPEDTKEKMDQAKQEKEEKER